MSVGQMLAVAHTKRAKSINGYKEFNDQIKNAMIITFMLALILFGTSITSLHGCTFDICYGSVLFCGVNYANPAFS